MARTGVAHNRIDFGPYRATERTLWRPEDDGFRPRYAVPQETHDALRTVERADQDVRRFEADAGVSHRILRDALTRNAWGTASIEGNPLTLAEVESLLAVAPTPDRASVPDEREILNYADLVNALDDVPMPRTTRDVRDLHARLFAGVLPDAGTFKDRPNFVGRRETREVVFVPTMPERVEDELAWALDWLQDADEHPIVRAMVFFHEFQSIHPFRDGNGRLGRALTTITLWHEGYRGVRYALVDWAFNRDRDAYYENLDEVRRRDWDFTPWVLYMGGILRDTYEAATQRFLFRDRVPEGLNDRQVRVAEWFARIDLENRGRRCKFADVHAAFPQVPRRTLQLDLATLVDAGVLHRAGERKGTTYAFSSEGGASAAAG